MKKANKDKKTKKEVRFREATSIIPPYEPVQVKDAKERGETGLVGGGGTGKTGEGDGEGKRERERGKVTIPMAEAKQYLEMGRGKERGPVVLKPAEPANNKERNQPRNQLRAEAGTGGRDGNAGGEKRGRSTSPPNFSNLVRSISPVRKGDLVMSGGRSNPETDLRPVGNTNQTREADKAQVMSPARVRNRSREDIDRNRDTRDKNKNDRDRTRDAREREGAEKRGNVDRGREREKGVSPDRVLKTEFEGLVRNIVKEVLDEDDGGQDNREGNGARREVVGERRAKDDICCAM
jgi:hypothetical protein